MLKKQRCQNNKCKYRSIMLTKCRCNESFCPLCINPSEHNCTFNYREFYYNIYKDENQKIINKKIDKI